MLAETDNRISYLYTSKEGVFSLPVRARVGESFETFIALKRSLPGMKSCMFNQVMFVFESFGTLNALVRPLVCK